MESPKKPDELLPTRQSLLLRLKNHEDAESWQEFFDTYWKLIYGVARKQGLTDSEAQDVVQETVIAVSKHIQKFDYDPKGSFKAWLLNMTRWRITDQFRKRLPVSPPLPKPDQARGTSTINRVPDPKTVELDKLWDKEYETHILTAAIERVKRAVNAKHYQIYDLYAVKRWPVAKVTQLLKVSEAQVYKVKSRIDEHIRKEVERLKTKLV